MGGDVREAYEFAEPAITEPTTIREPVSATIPANPGVVNDTLVARLFGPVTLRLADAVSGVGLPTTCDPEPEGETSAVSFSVATSDKVKKIAVSVPRFESNPSNNTKRRPR